MLQKALMFMGFHQSQALAMGSGTAPAVAVSAAGAAQSTATALTTDANLVTTVGASTGVSLPVGSAVGDMVFVANGQGTNALSVYPPYYTSSAEQINNLSANAAFSVAVNKGALFIKVSTTHWIAVGG